MSHFKPKEILLHGLKHFDIQVEREEGQTIFIENNLVILIDEDAKYRLLCDGEEVSPFRDVAEICHYIKTEHAKSRTEYRSPRE